jgi:nicotinamide riboside transporter PnuC
VILTLDGILLSAFAGLTLTKRIDVLAVVDVFGVETWVLLAAGAASLLVSIVSAVAYLASRTYAHRQLRRFLRRARSAPGRSVDLQA